MSAVADAASFRDPDGFVFSRDGTVYRQVNERCRQRYDHLVTSGLYDALVSEGLLVAHEEVDLDLAPAPGAYKVIRPEPVPFVSYPYEWSFGQLRDAALATLRTQAVALEHGAWLRDASAYNVQYRGSVPVLIDTLSFAPREDAPWPAYRQFCQHFLAPLALMADVDVRLGQLLRVHIDGVPLDLASELLPARTRLRAGLQLHLHAHARSQTRSARREGKARRPLGGEGDAGAGAGDGRAGKSTMSESALRGLADSLTGAVRKLDWSPPASVWRDYDELGSYTSTAFEHKKELVEAFLAEVQPSTVWDLGANTGFFSRLAADGGRLVVSMESDHSAVELNYREAAHQSRGQVLPLLVDLTNPSPAQGWEHRERRSLVDRGPAGLAMALALVHHLAIGNNVPLPRLFAHFRELCGWLLVEWVPKSDPRVQQLLESREDIFDDYTEAAFSEAARDCFSVERREPVRDSERVLYLLRARDRE